MAKAAHPTATCAWCTKPMEVDAIRCPSCGRLTKQIYYQKIICYVLCLAGGLLIGFGISGMNKKKPQADFYNYFEQNAPSSGGSSGTVMLIAGIVLALAGIYFWYIVSKKLGTYMWR
ncbi:MAG TPA: hypothetical protein VLJ68_05125 [Chitinophagaceae bacterium]|nr:hypothetical protein [Chitinophagaceae bacterium]